MYELYTVWPLCKSPPFVCDDSYMNTVCIEYTQKNREKKMLNDFLILKQCVLRAVLLLLFRIM